jgi:hypothetical protein
LYSKCIGEIKVICKNILGVKKEPRGVDGRKEMEYLAELQYLFEYAIHIFALISLGFLRGEIH